MEIISTIDEMDLDGGVACLDFVNSGLGVNRGEKAERFHSCGDLLVLAKRLALLDRRSLVRLSDRAAARLAEARDVLDRALKTRSRRLHSICVWPAAGSAAKPYQTVWQVPVAVP